MIFKGYLGFDENKKSSIAFCRFILGKTFKECLFLAVLAYILIIFYLGIVIFSCDKPEFGVN